VAKLSLSDFASIANQQTFINTLNANFALVEAALEVTLSRDGTSPNEMEADLDMNSNRILNLVAAVADTEPIRKAEFDDLETEFDTLETNINNALAAVNAAIDDLEVDAAALTAAVTAAQLAETNAETAETNAEAAQAAAEAALAAIGNLNSLSDVTITSPSSGEALVYNGTIWVNDTVSTVATLNDLTDVTITAAATGDYIRYNGSAWVDVAVSQLVTDLDSSFLTPAEGNAAYQPLDADLTSWAGVTRASGFDTFVATPSQANFMSLITDETFVVDADIGVTVQAYDADLTTLATAFTTASASGAASLAFHEDTDNGTNRVLLQGPASTADVTLTLQATTGTIYSTGGTDVAIADGGTGASTASAGFDALAEVTATTYGKSLLTLADETALEALLDTLPNLTSIQSLTVTLADAGANAFFGWDDTAGAYENLTAAEAEAIIEPLIDTLANLTSIQGVSFTFGAYAATLLNNADEAAFKASVNLEIGTDVQAYDADLTTLSTAFTTASASGAASLAFHEDTDNGTNRVLLQGPASTADVTLTLPAATDTLVGKDTTDTFTNKSIDLTNNTLVGSVAEFNTALESADFYTTGGADVALADGGTGASLSDPNADRFLWWDDSAGAVVFTDLLSLATEAAPAAGDFVLLVDAAGVHSKVNWSSLPGAGGGLGNVVEDLTPQLGGFLDWNGQTMSDALLTDTLVLDLQEGGILKLTNDAAGATGVVIQAHHDSASPALDDIPLSIEVLAGSDDEEIGKLRYRLIDGATTTEDGAWEFHVDVAGTSALQASVGDGVIIGDGTTFIGAGTLQAKTGIVAGDTTARVASLDASYATSPNNQFVGTDATTAQVLIGRFNNASNPPALLFAKSRNATIGSQTTVNSSDFLGVVAWEGTDGTNWEEAIELIGFVDGTVSAGVVPGGLQLTLENAAGAETQRMTWRSSGAVTMGSTAGPRLKRSLYNGTVSAAASLSFDVDPATIGNFVGFELHIYEWQPVTDGAEFWIRLGDSGGIDSGVSDYAWQSWGLDQPATALIDSQDTADDSITPTGTIGMGNASGEALNLVAFFDGNLADTTPDARNKVHGNLNGGEIDSEFYAASFAGQRLTHIDLTTIQLLYSTGNINSGYYELFGIEVP
jgi:hypothetical protein